MIILTGNCCFAWILKLVVLDYILRHFDEPFSYPHRLDDLEVGAQSDKDAQKLLYVVKFADVFISGLFGYDEAFQRQYGKLVGDLHGCGVRDLHLNEGVFCLEGCSGHVVGKLAEGIVVIT